MLRIAVDARPLAHPQTGIGRYTESLLKRLVESGHQWFLYSDRALALRFPVDDHVQLRQGHSRPGSPLSLVFTQMVFPRWARGDCVDLFWSPRHHLPLRLPPGMRSVVTVHDLVWKRYPETMRPLNRMLEQSLMGPSLRRADGVIAVSDFTSGELDAVYPELSATRATILEAADGDVADYEVDFPLPTKPFFLFVGTPEPRKNLQRLLQAFANARQRGLQHQLVIAGAGGWGSHQLDKQVAELSLEGSVVLRGRVSDAELGALYRASTALVMPSLYEGFGLPVLEAMKAGVPSIVSRDSSLPEVAGDAGLLVDPSSISSIADAILELAINPDLLDTLRAKARERAPRFSWDTAARETLAFLTQVANRATGHV